MTTQNTVTVPNYAQNAISAFFASAATMAEAHSIVQNVDAIGDGMSHADKVAFTLKVLSAEQALGGSFRDMLNSYSILDDVVDKETGIVIQDGLLSFCRDVAKGLDDAGVQRLLKNVKESIRKNGHPAIPQGFTVTRRQGTFLMLELKKGSVGNGNGKAEETKAEPTAEETKAEPTAAHLSDVITAQNLQAEAQAKAKAANDARAIAEAAAEAAKAEILNLQRTIKDLTVERDEALDAARIARRERDEWKAMCEGERIAHSKASKARKTAA
jgi:hypothetical protein